MGRPTLAIVASLTLSACGGGNGAAEVRDESKLSAALEQRARSIEARAQEAVAAAERDAATELARLNQEANASAAANDAAITDPEAPTPQTK